MFLMIKKSIMARRINRRQPRIQISKAVIDVQIGAEDLEEDYTEEIPDNQVIKLPGGAEHIEEDEGTAEEDEEPGKVRWKEERCLRDRIITTEVVCKALPR